MSEQLPTITAVVLTHNEEDMISNCLETLSWADDVIVVDTGSNDSTVDLAKRAGATVISTDAESFAERRNIVLKKIFTDWIFYLDADERVTPESYLELKSLILEPETSAIEFSRRNIHYGKWFRAGGWEDDKVTRLFRMDKFTGWTGDIHESPVFEGNKVLAKEGIVHLTHRDVVHGLVKSVHWTGIEAELLLEAKHPPVTPKTLLRKTVMEFLRRLMFKKGWKDGTEGWIEAFVQAFNRFLVYERLWELQRKPDLRTTYQRIDKQIMELWKKQ